MIIWRWQHNTTRVQFTRERFHGARFPAPPDIQRSFFRFLVDTRSGAVPYINAFTPPRLHPLNLSDCRHFSRLETRGKYTRKIFFSSLSLSLLPSLSSLNEANKIAPRFETSPSKSPKNILSFSSSNEPNISPGEQGDSISWRLHRQRDSLIPKRKNIVQQPDGQNSPYERRMRSTREWTSWG